MAALLLVSARLLAGPVAVVLVAAVLAAGLVLAPRASPAMLLRLFRAQKLTAHDAPELHAALADLAKRARLPKVPELYVVRNPAITAFSVGGPEDSAIGVSHRVLYRLAPRELTGIVAHEMSHVVASGMALLAVSQFIARLVRSLALFGILFAFVFGALGGASVGLGALLLVCAAPLGVSLIQLALSRNREFDADRAAAQLTGDPRGLASALQRIDSDHQEVWQRLFWPLGGQRMPTLLRTHPPTADRVARLLA